MKINHTPEYTLIGVDGNAFCIMGYVVSCMEKEAKSQEEIDKYLEEAKSSDYYHLIATSLEMIESLNKQTQINRNKQNGEST